METDVRSRIARNEYDSVTSGRAFAEKLTADLQSVSKDKHLRVRLLVRTVSREARIAREPTAAEIEAGPLVQQARQLRFRKGRANERATSGISISEDFNDHEAGAGTVAAAMTFLQNTEALIFDLRQNGGGSPRMIALISLLPVWRQACTSE